MITTSNNYEYLYQDNQPRHHHKYLMSPLMSMLDNATSSGKEKASVLDIGCGNGSLTNEIAKKGYSVVGIEESHLYHGYLKNVLLAVSGKIDQHFTSLWDGGHIKFFSVNTLKTLLELEGFINLKFDFAGRFPYIWKSMLCSCTLKSEA
ncbi:MAG: class I SAM-dependent methyltransferase [Xenococcus sp. MO_188.B8]|nr:class I SAM-dependent methyltransferase [Xenococcus sp. MO_188.B8]